MIQRMQTYDLTRAVTTTNAWQEVEKTFETVGTIDVAVSVSSGSTLAQNDVLRISSTHTGLTYSTSVQVGDRFGGYIVDYIIEGSGRRMAQLFLTKGEALPS